MTEFKESHKIRIDYNQKVINPLISIQTLNLYDPQKTVTAPKVTGLNFVASTIIKVPKILIQMLDDVEKKLYLRLIFV